MMKTKCYDSDEEDLQNFQQLLPGDGSSNKNFLQGFHFQPWGRNVAHPQLHFDKWKLIFEFSNFGILEFSNLFQRRLPSSAVTIWFRQYLRKASTPFYWCFYSTHGGQISILQNMSQTRWRWQNFILILFPLLFLLPEDGSNKMLIIKTYYLLTGLNVFFWMKWNGQALRSVWQIILADFKLNFKIYLYYYYYLQNLLLGKTEFKHTLRKASKLFFQNGGDAKIIVSLYAFYYL